MEYLKIPREVSIFDLRSNGASLSPGMYRGVEIPNSNVKRVGDLLQSYVQGVEVGSLAYIKESPYKFIRTKALQDRANLTELRGDSVISIHPKAFEKAVNSKPDRIIADGDILYGRGGSVGEVALAQGCGHATISGHILKLMFERNSLYSYAFMKHPICKLQQQPAIKGSIRTLDNFNIGTLLNCLIPFPNQPDSERVIDYISALMQAVIQKEKAIRERSEAIHNSIQTELINKGLSKKFQFEHPNILEIQRLKRTDSAIYGQNYRENIFLIENYTRGFVTPKQAGFSITPGPSLEIKIIKTRIDSDIAKPGFYALLLPMHISVYGTMHKIPYIGVPKSLPLLQEGDILFGEAGYQKGRSIVLLNGMEGLDRCTTNAHGLYARRADGDLTASIFFRCIFNWYRTMGLIDLMAVGGSGGHFSPEYFDYIRIPKFPDDVQSAIAALYHNPAPQPNEALTLSTFVEWHRRWNEKLGIWELDHEMKSLLATLREVQDQIIKGQTVMVPFN